MVEELQIHRAIELVTDANRERRRSDREVAESIFHAEAAERAPHTRVDPRLLDMYGLSKESADLARLHGDLRIARGRSMADRLKKGHAAIACSTCAEPPPNNDQPLHLPTCLFPATDSYPQSGKLFVDGSNEVIVDATTSEIQLLMVSNGVGGWLGIDAFPYIPPVSASLLYSLVPPDLGWLTIVAEFAVTGFMDCFTTAPWFTTPQMYGQGSLTVTVLAHQDGRTVQSSTLVSSIYSSDNNGKMDSFHHDIYVLVLNAALGTTNPVVIEVRADLAGIGRSDYGNAIGDFGIGVPELCLSWSPYVIN